MHRKRFLEAFKIEAVSQIVERGHLVAKVSALFGSATHGPYKWMNELQIQLGLRQE